MKTLDRVQNDVEEYLSSERYSHTMRVEREALRLGKSLGLNEDELKKVSLASLLHDIGKSKKVEQLLGNRCSQYSDLLEKLSQNGAIYHAHVGREIARHRYGIDDAEVLDAIRYHTTGRAEMKLIEKIVYLADYIEPARSFGGLEKVRGLSYSDIDRAMLVALNMTIVHIIEGELMLEEDTVKARNSLILKAKSRGERI